MSYTDILKRLGIGKSKEKFNGLYYGGDITGYQSPSEADLALCGLLARHTQDPKQIDRIFRGSALFRGKWDKKYGDGSTYGSRTIDKILKSQGGERLMLMKGYTAAELILSDFPAIQWVVEKLLAEGLIILAGKPKTGKSWMVLNLAIAIAIGLKFLGKFITTKGTVLYLALEDSPRRLKARLESVLQNEEPPENLHLITGWKKIGFGGLEMLRKWIADHKDVRLIIIDTLAKIRREAKKASTPYGDDYSAIEELKQIADDNGIAIMVVHHLRKAVADDPLDMVSGTTGLTGAADTIAVLTKSRGYADAELIIVGRDIDEQCLALNFDKENTRWCYKGSTEEYQLPPERHKILEALKKKEGPMSTNQIAKKVGKRVSNVSNQLPKLVEQGFIKRTGFGEYVHKDYA